MRHQQVVENFVENGSEGRGTYVKSRDGLLYAQFPSVWRPYGLYRSTSPGDGRPVPLAARLEDGNVLINGARLAWPIQGQQAEVLRAAEHSPTKFGVVPFHSVVAAWTDGKVNEWERAPIPTRELQREVGVVVPSAGEQWRTVTVKDKYGREQKREVHTLGDSVIRVRERFYLSAVDETGQGSGMYFLAELITERAPASLAEAFDLLKPPLVRETEARGANVMRQGEWFAVPTLERTSHLMQDVERGIAVYLREHVLGRDGHHKLEEAVIYKAGPRKGEVYARGVLKHTREEHSDLDLGTIRWYRVIRNVQQASYTLSGRGHAQFD